MIGPDERSWSRTSYYFFVPMVPREFYEYIQQATDSDRRLPLSRMTGWEIFPFERGGLHVVELKPPTLPEPPRVGEGERRCPGCVLRRVTVWSNDHWRLWAAPPSGSPLVLMLEPCTHYDLTDLPDDRAEELGLLVVHIARAIESLPHIARAHVARWGDGSAHLHVFFYARPVGFSQLRGTCLAIWDSLLPPIPAAIWERDAVAVGRVVTESLAAHHGGGS